MALVAGSVTVSDVGVATGSDLALAIYNQELLALAATPNPIPKVGPVAVKQSIALQATYLAAALAPYINANVTTGSGDVVGPGSATDSDIALFDGTTGKLIRDSGLTIAAVAAALQAYTDNAVATVINDLLLADEPTTPGTTYSNTFVSLQITQEVWRRTSDSSKLKQIDYTYVGLQLGTEVRKVFASDGTTIVAELTITYTYTGLSLSGEIIVRNI